MGARWVAGGRGGRRTGGVRLGRWANGPGGDNASLRHYDFIEIGTSDFDTLLEDASEDTVGISVEPLYEYLDALPNKPLVRKIQAAISNEDAPSSFTFFYVPPHEIAANNWPFWLRGCNSLGKRHPLHDWHDDWRERKKWTGNNPPWQTAVAERKVPVLSVKQLFKDNSVKSVDVLKLDTEGHDTTILQALYPYLVERGPCLYPQKIEFESNEHCPYYEVEKTINLYKNLGYAVKERGQNTVLELSDTLEDDMYSEQVDSAIQKLAGFFGFPEDEVRKAVSIVGPEDANKIIHWLTTHTTSR